MNSNKFIKKGENPGELLLKIMKENKLLQKSIQKNLNIIHKQSVNKSIKKFKNYNGQLGTLIKYANSISIEVAFLLEFNFNNQTITISDINLYNIFEKYRKLNKYSKTNLSKISKRYLSYYYQILENLENKDLTINLKTLKEFCDSQNIKLIYKMKLFENV